MPLVTGILEKPLEVRFDLQSTQYVLNSTQ